MKKIILNGIEFNVNDLNEFEDEGRLKLEFTIVSEGDREYHLVKELLSKSKIKYENEENIIKMRMLSLSHQSPNELTTSTKAEFLVTLVQWIEDDDPSPTANLAIEMFKAEQKFNFLLDLLSEKGILDKTEFDKGFSSYFKSLNRKTLSDFTERVFGKRIEELDE